MYKNYIYLVKLLCDVIELPILSLSGVEKLHSLFDICQFRDGEFAEFVW